MNEHIKTLEDMRRERVDLFLQAPDDETRKDRWTQVAALAAATDALTKVDDWALITDEQKNGSAMLLCWCRISGDEWIHIGYWDRDEEVWRTLDGERIELAPTYWRRIPAGPNNR